MLCAFGHRDAICSDMLGIVGSNLPIFKLEPTTPNTSQHGGQTHTTCCAKQCCDILRWHVAIVWPGLKTFVARHFTTALPELHTSAICCFFSSLTLSVNALWSLSMMTKLLLWGWMTNFRGVYWRGVATWLKTAPNFSRAKILGK